MSTKKTPTQEAYHHTYSNETKLNHLYRPIKNSDKFTTWHNVDIIMVLKASKFGFSCSTYIFIIVNQEKYNCTTNVFKYMQGPLTIFK